jgi:hypothetical protein
MSAGTDAFVDSERGYLQATGFVLNPTSRVVIGSIHPERLAG